MARLPVWVLVVLALVASLSALAFALYGYRYREQPGANAFVAFAGVFALVPLAVLWAAEGAELTEWENVATLLFYPYTVTWLLFAVTYSGASDQFSRGRLALLLFPAVVGFVDVLYAAVTGVALPSGEGPGLLYVFYLPTVMYAFALLFGGAVLLIRAGYVYVSTNRMLTTSLATGAIAPAVLPFVFNAVLVSGSATPPGSYLLAYLVTVIPFWVAIVRYDLFGSVPVAEAIGRSTVVTEMDDAMVVVANDETVVDMNDAAQRLFDTTLSEVGGRSLGTVLDGEAASISEVADIDTFERRDGARQRYYEVTISALSNDAGQTRGHALVFHDVTERTLQRQRLDVLNRLLRHNLRNKMVLITGRAGMIANEEVSDPSAIAADIESAGNELVQMGNRARTVERMMTDTPQATDCPVTEVVEDVFADVTGRFPDATLENEVPADLVATVNELHLRTILENLVDNGIRHDDSGDPAVVVRGYYDAEAELPVEVVVEDSGPGIPQSELSVIREGREDDLEHTSGIGLWAVYWGTLQIGGTVEFDPTPDGTTVTLRLPGA